MARFCGSCGSLLGDSTQFCGSCGKPANASANAQAPASPPAPAYAPVAQSLPAFTPVPQPGAQPSPASAPAMVSRPPNKSNTLVKVVIAVVGVLCIGAVIAIAGTVYVVHKVHEKVKAVERQALGEGADSQANEQKAPGGLSSLLSKAAGSSDSHDGNSFNGDPCRILSKDDVGHAAGVEITRTEAKDSGCTYYAKGDPADMVSRHATAMAAGQSKAKGSTVSPEAQKMMQQFAGAFFKQQEASSKDLSAQAASGEVPVVSVSYTTGNAEIAMKLNRLAFNRMGGDPDGETTDQRGTGDLKNYGDEAYEMGGTGLIMRKGQTVVQMMFPYCPCDAESMKPLLTEAAAKL